MIYASLFNIIMPVIICVGIGYAWDRLGRPFDTDFTSDLVMNVGTPCLVISSLIAVELELGEIYEMMYACILVMIMTGIIASTGLMTARYDLRAFLPSLMFGNIGNMGLPICLFAFGEQGLALAVAYFTTAAVAMFTFGPVISQNRMGHYYLKVVTQPIVLSVVAALVIKVTGKAIPLWLLRPIQLTGDITIPIMLMTLGVSLRQLKWIDMPRSLFLGLMRILLGCVVAVAVVWALEIEGTARAVIIMQSAMPVAVFNYLFAVRYKRSPEKVAGIVVFSTLISFVLLPIILSFLITVP